MRVFDVVRRIFIKTYQVFRKESQIRNKNLIRSLKIIKDGNINFIVAMKHYSKTVAIFNEHEENGFITHFKFEEKVIKIGVNYNYKNGCES